MKKRSLTKLLPMLLAITLTLAPSMVYAVQPDEIMSDATQEARARALSRELRCMVCRESVHR